MRNFLPSASCSLPPPYFPPNLFWTLRGFILNKPECCCLPSYRFIPWGLQFPSSVPCGCQMWFPMVPYRDDAKQRSDRKPQAFFILQKRVRSRLAVMSIASLMKAVHLIRGCRCLGRRQLFYSPDDTIKDLENLFPPHILKTLWQMTASHWKRD